MPINSRQHESVDKTASKLMHLALTLQETESQFVCSLTGKIGSQVALPQEWQG